MNGTASVIGVTLVPVFILWYDWPKIKYNPLKDKAAFLGITAAAWVLAILLIFNPEMPGTTELINFVYKPLGKLLKK